MLKAILFAGLFAVVGLVVFPFIAFFLFRGSDPQQLGAASFPFIVLVCGAIGFIVGWLKKKKS